METGRTRRRKTHRQGRAERTGKARTQTEACGCTRRGPGGWCGFERAWLRRRARPARGRQGGGVVAEVRIVVRLSQAGTGPAHGTIELKGRHRAANIGECKPPHHEFFPPFCSVCCSSRFPPQVLRR